MYISCPHTSILLTASRLGLRANRRAASNAFQRAQKAEQAYRAKRQATNARNNAQEARAHFKESRVQFVAGWKKGVSALKCVPGVTREKVCSFSCFYLGSRERDGMRVLTFLNRGVLGRISRR
jgi:hypothetical protein